MRETRVSWFGLSLRSARAHAGTLAIFALTVLLAALVMSLVTGFLSLSATQQARATIASAPQDAQRFTVITPLSDDAGAQRAAADQIVHSLVDTNALSLTVTETSVAGRPSLTLAFRPDSPAFSAAAIPGLVDGLSQLQRVLSSDQIAAPNGVSTEGTLPATLAQIQATLSVEQAATGAPIALTAIITLVALALGARLLIANLRDELTLARSRGATVGLVAFSATVMACACALPAAAVGVAGAATILGVWFGAGVAHVQLLPAAAVAVAAAVVVLAEAVRVARASATRATERNGFVANIVTLVLVFVVAGVSLVQFLVRHTPLQVSAAGTPFVDPVVAAAPAFALLAVIVVGLGAFSPTARALEATLSRGSGSTVVYPARYLARHTALHIASATVVALAIGSFVFASAFTATSSTLADKQQLLIAGSDIRVIGVTPDMSLAPAAERTSGRVLVSAATVGSDAVELVAMPHDAVSSLMTSAGGLVDTEMIADSIPSISGGVLIADGALDIEMRSETHLTSAAVTAVLVNPQTGTVAELPVPASVDAGLLLVTVRVLIDCPEQQCTVTLRSPTPGIDAFSNASGAQLSTALVIPRGPTELTYSAPDIPTTVPVVITRALASRLALSVGDDITVALGSGSRQFSATITRAVDLIPGTTNPLALVADLGTAAVVTHTFTESPLVSNEVWLRSDDEMATVASLTGYTVVSANGSALSPTPSNALWLGAIGATALALAAAAAGAALSARSRRTEPALLRALGMSWQQVWRVVTTEQVLVGVFSLGLGIVAGTIVAAITVPDLARASLPGVSDSLAAPLAIDLVSLVIASCVTVVALLTIAIVAGWRASRVSSTRRAL